VGANLCCDRIAWNFLGSRRPANAEFCGGLQAAITRRWIFRSNPAIHFRRCSEAAIGVRMINFSA
jgi:hypothetical protein